MPTFNSCNHVGEPEAKYNDILEDLIKAAGGAPLPGKLGLVQALFNIWTQEQHGHPWLRRPKLFLNTLGVFYEYKKSSKLGDLLIWKDPVEEFLKKNKLSLSRSGNRIANFILIYSKNSIVEKFQFKNTSKKLIKCKLPNDIEYYMSYYDSDGKETSVSGPYITDEQDYSKFQDGFANLVWEMEEMLISN
jgi:hypothetical protein